MKVGLVFLTGILIVVIAILSFGHLGDLFQPKRTLKAGFNHIGGLRAGAPVWLGGVEMGYVSEIRFPTEMKKSHIEVEMVVAAEMATLIRSDSTASIRSQGLLGDKYVEITLGSLSEPPLPLNHPLDGIAPVDMKELMLDSSLALGELGQVLLNLNGLMTKIDEGQGAVGRFINDPRLYEELTQLSAESRILIQHIEEGKGLAGKLLRDPRLYDQITAVVSRLETILGSFEQISWELRHGQGTLGKLTADPAIYNNLTTATARLDHLLAKVEAGEGFAGQLLTDQELSKDLKSAVVEFKSASAEFQELVKDIRGHPEKYFRFSLF